MKVAFTPRFEKSKYGTPWYSFEINLITYIMQWIPLTEIELLIPEKQIDLSKLELLILGGGTTPGEDVNRDQFESGLLKSALSCDIRVLGICRGAQLISNHFGGTLEYSRSHIDVTRDLTGPIPSIGKCFHRNSINNLPSNFKVIARDLEDSSIEVFFDSERKLLGLMNHPERESNSLENFRNLVKSIDWL